MIFHLEDLSSLPTPLPPTPGAEQKSAPPLPLQPSLPTVSRLVGDKAKFYVSLCRSLYTQNGRLIQAVPISIGPEGAAAG